MFSKLLQYNHLTVPRVQGSLPGSFKQPTISLYAMRDRQTANHLTAM